MVPYFISVYDCPGIFFVKDYMKGEHYASYVPYDGTNFKVLFDDVLAGIRSGKKQTIAGRWEYSFQNLFNPDYWTYIFPRRIFYYVCFAVIMATPLKILIFGLPQSAPVLH